MTAALVTPRARMCTRTSASITSCCTFPWRGRTNNVSISLPRRPRDTHRRLVSDLDLAEAHAGRGPALSCPCAGWFGTAHHREGVVGWGAVLPVPLPAAGIYSPPPRHHLASQAPSREPPACLPGRRTRKIPPHNSATGRAPPAHLLRHRSSSSVPALRPWLLIRYAREREGAGDRTAAFRGASGSKPARHHRAAREKSPSRWVPWLSPIPSFGPIQSRLPPCPAVPPAFPPPCTCFFSASRTARLTASAESTSPRHFFFLTISSLLLIYRVEDAHIYRYRKKKENGCVAVVLALVYTDTMVPCPGHDHFGCQICGGVKVNN